MNTNHPKGGTSIKMSKSQAKAPQIRHTNSTKRRELLWEFGSVTIANAIVPVQTSIINSTMMTLCSWNRAPSEF